MLYGTRKELNKKLKRMFGNDERFALLVWTKQDVMAQAENMTETEADALLELIGRAGAGEHTEEGVSFRTVQALYARIRPNIPRLNIPVDTLFRITDIAAQALSGEDAKVWSLTADHYPSIADAQAEIAWLKRELANENATGEHHMYGTVSEICIELLKKHENHEKMAIITWAAEDVREAGAEYNPTRVMIFFKQEKSYECHSEKQ